MVLESNTLDVLFVKDGQQGEDGKILYTWIKYAKDANGTGMTDDPNGAVYIGISYNNESSTESNDPAQYAWTKIQGADGKKGEDAYTIFLENENISFATDENRDPLSEQAYTSGITIMKGAKPVTDFTIGDIAKTQGIAVAKTDTAIAISVVNGNTLPSDNGAIEIPISVGGTVFKKILSWTCSKKGEKGIQGIQGPQGAQGEKGKDGTSVTITNKSITYQLSTSGTTIPTGTWQTSPQTIPEGQYQWTKTSVTYSDGNKTESYSISYRGKNGSDGTSVKTTSTSVKYQVGDSGTTKPTGTWQNSVPTVAQGKYLWTQTIVNYSDGNSTESYSVSYKGIDGSNGSNGMNAATVYLYQRATSTPSKPSNVLTYTFSTTKITGTLNNGWSTAIPMGADAVYVTVASVSSKNDTTTIATSAWSAPVVLAQNGKSGSDGKAGLNVATIYLYQRATSTPSKPSASVTYTFSTGVASGLNNGWSQKIPDGTHPLYVTLATASSNTATDTILSSEWSDVVVMAQNGEDGSQGYSIAASVQRPNKDESWWRQIGAIGHHDIFDDTLSIRNGCRVGDIFTIMGTASDTGNAHTAYYRSTTNSDNLEGECINHIVANSGSDGAGFHWNLVKGTDVPKEFQPYNGVNVGCTFYEIDFRDKTINSDDKFAISFDFEWTQFAQNDSGTFDWWFQGAVNKGWDEGNPFTYAVGQVIKKNMSSITDGAGSYHVECYTSGIGSKLYEFGVRFDNSDGTGTVKISNFKLEEGDKPSPWCTTYEETLAKNLSITPSSQYFKSTDGGKTFAPNTITIKPTIQGEISFGKWQYSIDGGVSFADVVSGQKGLTISNNVLSVSKDSSLYSDAVTMVTFRAVANDSSFYDTCSIAKIYDVSDIGDGRNLLTGVSSYTKDTPFEKTDSRADGWIVYQNIITSIELEAGKKYVLQAKTDGNWAANHDTNGQDPSKKLVTLWLCSDKTNNCFDMRKGYVVFTPTVTAKYKLRVNQYSNGTDAYTIHLWDIKLEKGSSPTGWTPAPEDVQTAILSTKSEISSVSSKVDQNTKSIENRVEKTTYERELTLVKGDISKANEGLNKWRYEIYPKSLFASEYQGKSTMDVFAKNTNLTPSQSVLINDTDLSIAWNYDNNYIGYALTFVKFSAAKSVAITFAHDDGAHIYLNGKLIGGSDAYNQTGESLTLGFVKGWNCIEVVVNEGAATEGFKLGTTISAISECQLMNCYYGTPVARQSHITNQLVENTTNIEGISGKVQKVMTTVGNSGNIDEFVNNYSTWKTSVDKIETRVGEKYTTKDEFNGLEIGGRNLILNSAFKNDRKEWSNWGNPTTREIVSSNGKMWAHIVGNKQNYQGFNQWTPAGSIKEGDHITFSARIKGSTANQRFTVGIHWLNSGNTIISQDWHTFIVDTTENVYTWTVDASGSGCNKLNLMVGVSDPSVIYNVYFTEIMVVKGNKSSDWTPAPEDDEINGQNLVSNLPSNWEQGTFQDGKTNVGCDYDTNKAFMTTRIRVKELVPVSGNITISNAYSNQSKKPIQNMITAFDVNKKWLGSDYISTAWSDFPRIVDLKDAKYIAVVVRYKDESAITPSDISQICLKIERGTSATPFTLAPEDVNGKIVNVETIANQTAKKFEWIVKGESTSSNLVLTDNALTAIANNINLKGKVTFESFTTDAKNEIGKVAQSKVDDLEVGGRNLVLNSKPQEQSSSYGFAMRGLSMNLQAGVTYTVSYCGRVIDGDGSLVVYLYTHDWKSATQKATKSKENTVVSWQFTPTISGTFTMEAYSFLSQNVAGGNVYIDWYKVEKGNHPTDWTPAPEDYLPQASLVSNWTTNTTWIDGGKIYTDSITADKIATDAIKSRNYISSGGTQGSFLNLSDGSFTSPNLSWDSNGNLIAKNANLSGQITATTGSIGKFEITDQWLCTGSGSTCAGLGGNQAFWAGAESSNSAPFRVGYDGKFVSSNADISGKITATEGKIGKYEITDTCLITGSGSTCTGIGGNFAFWAGGEDSYFAPFRVGYDGQLNIEHIKVHGNQEDVHMTIAKDYLIIQDVNTSAYIGLDGFDFDFANSRIKTGDQGIELYGSTPYIDFHYNNSSNDYTSRIIAQSGWDCLTFTGSILLGADLYTNGWIYNASGGHYTWNERTDAYISCGNYNNTNNVYYYAGYHAFYVNGDSGSGMMYIETSGVSSRKGFRNSSDERIKQNFSHFDDNFVDTYMNLEPVQYQFKNDTDDKYHFGFKAQQTERILNAYGQESDKSYGLCAIHTIDPEKAEKLYGVKDMHEEYTLAYDELIAPTTYMVQHIYKELEQTKQEKADLEARLQAIEAKLGL